MSTVRISQRPEFADVTPIPQDLGPRPVLAIKYTEEYAEVMDYLRAFMKADERSPRALDLVTEALLLNSSHYAAWHYRRRIVETLNAPMEAEFAFAARIAEASPKNYQLWYHRRWCVERTNDPSREMEHTRHMLEMDAKNYHVWTHRQWVVSTYKLWEEDFAFVNVLLEEDVRNNSAWNERFFVIQNTTGFTPEVLERERQYTMAKIDSVPHNESAWNYLTGIHRQTKQPLHTFPELLSFARAVQARQRTCTFAHILELDIHASRGDHAAAAEVARRLQSLDHIRTKYWLLIENQHMRQVGESQTVGGERAAVPPPPTAATGGSEAAAAAAVAPVPGGTDAAADGGDRR